MNAFKKGPLYPIRSLALSLRLHFKSNDLCEVRQLVKPYIVQNASMIMSVFPIKGLYQRKNDFRYIMKVGVMILEFIPKTKEQPSQNGLAWNRKSYFTLSMKQLGEILSLNEYKIANNDITMELKNPIRPGISLKNEEKTLQIGKRRENDFFNFALVTKELENIGNPLDSLTKIYSLDVNLPEFLLIQEFCRFLLPHLLGWHLLAEPKQPQEECF